MADVYAPTNEGDLASLIRGAAERRMPLEVCGFRTKRDAGRPLEPEAVVSASKLTGITLYEPSELVLSARAGTTLAEIEAALDAQNQELAFEPTDFARVFTKKATGASIGGIFAMNVSGSRRILRGAARDHLLGVRAVNGRGEIIKAGGRVMKNVTGVDLVRGLCNSWGTLAVLTEVTMKVMPRAPDTRTLLFFGLADEAAVGVMCAAMGTPFEVSGTVHLCPAFVARLEDKSIAPAGLAATALRLEGPESVVASRVARLRKQLAPFGETYELQGERSRAFWSDIRGMAHLVAEDNRPLWRISTAPSKAAPIVRALSALLEVNTAYDWSGGLIWVEVPPSSDASVTEVRRILAEFGADAMLIRAPRAVRASIEVFQPVPLAKMRLIQGLKKAFDPAGILNPGRMYAGV